MTYAGPTGATNSKEIMRALYLGESEFVGPSIVSALREAGHVVSTAPQIELVGRDDLASRFDLIVDNAAKGAEDVRTAVRALGAGAGHYVLMSSCQVYPATLRLRPFRPEELDPCSDLSLRGLPPDVAGPRAAERELHLLCRGSFPFTVLRPALIDGADDPQGRAAWFVDRILDGGLLVLPDGKLPIFRHVTPFDLARAVRTIAGVARAFGQTLNVVSQGVFNYWGYAAMLRDGLGVELKFRQVPADRWRAAGLHLPMGEQSSASFIEQSPLLGELGWTPTEEWDIMIPISQQLRRRPRSLDHAVRQRELQVLSALDDGETWLAPGWVGAAQEPPANWRLLGWPGQPASFCLQPMERLKSYPTPVLRTQRLALGAGESMLLRGELNTPPGSRVLGHNALLEVLQSDRRGPAPGTLCIPWARLPCEDPACGFCHGAAPQVLGLDCDGYGLGLCYTPASHLVEVPRALRTVALLADPLACLLHSLAPALRDGTGPVWICGMGVDAALASWLAQDAGRAVVHVDREPMDHSEFPVIAIEKARAASESGEQPRPTIVIELSGRLSSWAPLGEALSEGGQIYAHHRPMGAPGRTEFISLPLAAPTRTLLEQALELLGRWAVHRDLGPRIGPAIPLGAYWDLFLGLPYRQPYLDAAVPLPVLEPRQDVRPPASRRPRR